jgi:hypothetical protein
MLSSNNLKQFKIIFKGKLHKIYYKAIIYNFKMSVTVLGQATEKSVRVMTDPNPKLGAAGYQIVGVRERENADFNIR